MRGKGLKIFIIFLDLVFIAAVAGAVYFVFFTDKLKIDVPDPVKGMTVGRTSTTMGRVGLTDVDLKLFAEVFQSQRPENGEPAAVNVDNSANAEEETTSVDNLVVIGVIYDTEAPEDSVAIIFDRESGKQENLFVGDEYKGWKFDSIKDRITVIFVKGEERKEVTKTKDNVVASAAGAGPQPGAVNPNKPGAGNPYNPSGLNPRSNPVNRDQRGSSKQGSSNTIVPSNQKKTIPRSFIEQLSKNRDQYLQQVFAKPFYEAGRAIGMEVVKLDTNGPLKYFGVQQGDIILTWNGETINSEKKCYDLMNQYNDPKTIPAQNNIVLIRNGTRVNLSIELR
ncbi:MAG: hypothetical protein Kow00107_09210 [Planctomycetota bacterium]